MFDKHLQSLVRLQSSAQLNPLLRMMQNVPYLTNILRASFKPPFSQSASASNDTC